MCSIPDGSLQGTIRPVIPKPDAKEVINNQDDQGADITSTWQTEPILPIGILRLLTWMEKKGYGETEIYDINNLRSSDQDLIKKFNQIKPDVVGLSAPLSHCYPNIKRISKILRGLFPNVWIVLGGNLVSSSNMVLRKTEVDICVLGDGEIAFTDLLDYIKANSNRKKLNYKKLAEINGLTFINEENNFQATGYADQLPEKDLEYPDYDKLKAGYEKFTGKGDLILEHFRTLKDFERVADDLKPLLPEQERAKFSEKYSDKRIAYINLSRGCVARCTFCQRYTKGFRTYKVQDLEAYLLELKNKYNIGVVMINDENSFSNKAQAYQVAKIMKKVGMFWEIDGGARVKSMNYEDIKFFKEHGLLRIQFGIEAGSQNMLDIMEKKFKKEDVLARVSECASLGVQMSHDSIIIGMPGETPNSIIESGEFVAEMGYLKQKNWYTTVPFTRWALPIPGTPLYEYAKQIGAIGPTIEDEEEYLIRLSDQKNNFLNHVNTTEYSNKELYYWNYLFHFAGKRRFKNLIIKNSKSIKNTILEIYNKCIKYEFDQFIYSVKFLYKKKSDYKKRKIKFFLVILNHLVLRSLSLSTIFLPKVILFAIVKMYSNLKYLFLVEKKFKVKNGKQKYNLFMERNKNVNKDLVIAQERIAQTDRQIERSLRNIVMANRKQLKTPITNEEKNLEILATGQ